MSLFKNESGGHRWQTISPTDKKGRVHTSTVTVAVLEPLEKPTNISEKDIEYKTTRSGGPGGQNVNKLETCVIATHIPTGLSVRISNRNQYQNKVLATQILSEKIKSIELSKAKQDRSDDKKSQVGSGMRGDKRRTYREKDNQIVDHITGQTWKYKKWIKGQW